MKIKTAITVTHGPPGRSVLAFGYEPSVEALLRKYPGCRYAQERHGWLVPEEMAKKFAEEIADLKGWEVRDNRGWRDGVPAVYDGLYPYQATDVERFLKLRYQRAMIAWEMGCGKTVFAIAAMQAVGARRIVVVCPAMAREVWLGELDKWWKYHPEVDVIRSGQEAAGFAVGAPDDGWIAVVSYELVGKMLVHWDKVDFVVIDESQYVKTRQVYNRTVRRSREVRMITERVADTCPVIELTGTPIMLEPIDIHNQADILYPGRLGTHREFGTRYCKYDVETNEFYGTREDTAAELADRLGAFVFRRTKSEPDVAKYLPELIVEQRKVRTVATSVKVALRELEMAHERNDLEPAISAVAGAKVTPLANMVLEDFEVGVTHVGVFSWFRATASNLAKALERELAHLGVSVFHVDGSLPDVKRHAVLKQAREAPKAVLVGTIASVNIGINLTKFSPAYAVELYGSPGIMEQWGGRFHRVGGEASHAVVRLLVLAGSAEEGIARRLTKRLREAKRAMPQGVVAGQMSDALDEKESQADILKRWQEEAKNDLEADEYGAF